MKKKRILVVDDELDMRTFIVTLLETSGYRPIVATNGEEGIAKAREHKPAVIILDVMMPKEGGVQMYRELKTDEQLKSIPVIMLSAIAKKTFFHSQKLLNTYRGQVVPEPEAYIEKPPETEQLLKVLDDCIGCDKFQTVSA
jgi:two-component system phosphate regulon response regulator PhoB